MKLARLVGIGVLVALLAPSSSAAQDDGGEWEGRIEYTKYIGISGHDGHHSERTASSGNGVRVVSSSSHDIDRDINGKLTVSVWLSGGRTTVVVTGKSDWSREDDTWRTDADGRTTCDGESFEFFSETAFTDTMGEVEVSLDEANRFTIATSDRSSASQTLGNARLNRNSLTHE